MAMGYEMENQNSILSFFASLRRVKSQMLVFCLIIVSVLGTSATHAQLDGSAEQPAMIVDSLLPEAGSVITDPEFGTRIVRVTDERDGADAQVSNAGSSSFNLDATRFFVSLDGTPTLYNFEPEDLRFQKEGPLFGDIPIQFDGSTWSARDRNTLIGLADSSSAARIYSYNTRTRDYVLLKDFSDELPAGEARKLTKSAVDDNHFAFIWRESGQAPWRYVVAWDRASDHTYRLEAADPVSGISGLDDVRLDRSGSKVVVTGDGKRVWDYRTDVSVIQSAPSESIDLRRQTSPESDSLGDLSNVLDTRNGVSAAIVSSGGYIYVGVHPGRTESAGWVGLAGTAVYRKARAKRDGAVGFVHYKGQELSERNDTDLESAQWHYDSAAGMLYLRLPDDSNPNSRSARDAAPIVGEWRTAGDSVIRVPRSGGAAAERLADRSTNSWTELTNLRAGASRDGRFLIFNSGSGGSHKDVFIAALVSTAAAADTLIWTNEVNCTAIDNSLEKTGGKDQSDDASANSIQSIATGDGEVEFTASESDTERWCGLSNTNEIHQSGGDINFAIKLGANKKAEVRENGSLKAKIKYKSRNKFRVAVEAGVVNYYKGDSLFYTSNAAPQYPLLVTASLLDKSSTINNATIKGASTRTLVSISPGRVTLQPGQSRQFYALVTGATKKTVTWSATSGTITNTGFYSAPNIGGTYIVKATSVADLGVSASALVIVEGVADTTAPLISSVATSGVTANGATVSWNTNEPSDSQVEYGFSTAYGSSAPSGVQMVTAHSAALTGLSTSTLYHYRVKSQDAAGNLGVSGDDTFTTAGVADSTPPVIGTVATSGVSSSAATVSWSTNEAADSQVEYGTSTAYGASTAVAGAMVTSHGVTLSGLSAGTPYHYRVKSRDAAGNLATSGDFTFTTQSSGGTGTTLITDRNVYPEPAAPALPRAGGTYVDPVFRTTVMRVTDENDGTSCVNAYSYWPTFNLNSTRFFVACDDTPKLYRFDPEAFQILSKEPMFTQQAPGGGWPNTEDLTWSALNPNIIFAHVALRLYAYDVTAKTYNLIKDFTGELPAGHMWQMSRSIDDNIIAFTRRDPNYSNVGWVVWRRDQNRILLNTSMPGVDEVQIDKSGRYLNAKADFGGGVDVRIIDLQTGSSADLTDAGPDYSPGHSDSGTGIVVGHDNFNNGFTFRRLATPHQFQQIVGFGNDWTQGNHVSMLANDEGWAMISNFNIGSVPAGVFHNEIFQVATDGSGRVRRIAHHRSIYYSYYDQPRANISRDGRFAAYTSNWGSRTRRDVFIVRISGGGSAPPPPPGDTTAPSISSVASSGVSGSGATITWTTNEASDTQVEYGTTTSYGGSTSLNSAMVASHSATLSGLSSSTLYHYRVKSRDVSGNLATSGDFTLTTTAGSSGPPAAGRQNVVWTGIVNCSASGNTLQKVGGRDDTPDAGAVSQQSIASGDGYLEFTATQTDKLGFCGLARTPSGTDFSAIDFAIKLTGRGVAEVRENNLYKSELSYSAGDLFRISVESGAVKYYRNGVSFYASAKTPAYSLVAAASLINMNTTVGNAVMSTGTVAFSVQRRSLFNVDWSIVDGVPARRVSREVA